MMDDISEILQDLKYMNRLDKMTFWELLFPNSLEYYATEKWNLFRDSPLHFLWGCDSGIVTKMWAYVQKQKWGEE
jgi:hypothetical protein